MGRVLFAALLSLVASSSGCTCRGSGASARAGDDAAVAGDADGATGSGPDPSRAPPGPATYSLPIGAAILPSTAHADAGADAAAGGAGYLVASLVARRHAIALVRFDARGERVWENDVIADAGWTSEAELRVFAAPGGPAGDGAIVVYRGVVGGVSTRVLVAVDANGDPKGGPDLEVSSACATREGAFWIATSPGSVALRVRRFGSDAARDVVALPVNDDLERSLVCTDDEAVLFEQSDDLLASTRFTAAGAVPLGNATLGGPDLLDDDEADVVPFVVRGGEPGFVFHAGPRLAVTEQRGTETRRRDPRGLAPGDDVVDVEASGDDIYIATTRETKRTCDDEEPAKGVHVRRVSMTTEDPGVGGRVADASCDVERGPFFTSILPSGYVVGWPERAAAHTGSPTPLVGFGYATLSGGDVTSEKRIAIAADGIADAGCDDTGCAFVALVRPVGTDGMVPDQLRIIRYPAP